MKHELLRLSKYIIVVVLSFVCFSHVNAVTVGDMAPDFAVYTTTKELFKISDFKGRKPIYLIFWNTWCPFCIRKMPVYQEIYTFNGEEIEVLALNTSNKDSYDEMLSFIDRHQVDIPMAFDFGGPISKKYSVSNTPTVFIIDINGMIQHRNDLPDDIDAHILSWSQLSASN